MFDVQRLCSLSLSLSLSLYQWLVSRYCRHVASSIVPSKVDIWRMGERETGWVGGRLVGLEEVLLGREGGRESE